MPFIGAVPAQKYISLAKQDFTTIAGTGYTLDQSVTNEVDIALFINHVRQEPTTAYTASGTTLTLTSATTTSDDMYCVFLAKATESINPPDGSVGTAQLEASAVTNAKIADSTIALGKMASTFKNGITMADQFRHTANKTSDGDLTTNLERVDDATFSKIGTGMTESSGIFSFPSTGLYLILTHVYFGVAGADTVALQVNASSDSGSTYDTISLIAGGAGTSTVSNSGAGFNFINVTDASTFRVKFTAASVGSGSSVHGDTAINRTSFTFIKIGDSQ